MARIKCERCNAEINEEDICAINLRPATRNRKNQKRNKTKQLKVCQECAKSLLMQMVAM